MCIKIFGLKFFCLNLFSCRYYDDKDRKIYWFSNLWRSPFPPNVSYCTLAAHWYTLSSISVMHTQGLNCGKGPPFQKGGGKYLCSFEQISRILKNMFEKINIFDKIILFSKNNLSRQLVDGYTVYPLLWACLDFLLRFLLTKKNLAFRTKVNHWFGKIKANLML